ncbi:MAG: hypothetical protein QNJ47_29070 [Nostocaceae cyanobacterium]|nr:hypothetical protein [Nostocaceae cyanobacterium]
MTHYSFSQRYHSAAEALQALAPPAPATDWTRRRMCLVVVG